MYNAKVFRVFIASPSDLLEERDIVENACHEWNNLHGVYQNIILLPVRWEIDAYASHGESGQEKVNNQILNDADYLIGLFKSRLGSPTNSYNSGTVEEIMKHTTSGKPASIYFSESMVKLNSIDPDQLVRVREFRTWCEDNGLIKTFDSLESFKTMINGDISKIFTSNPELLVEDKPKIPDILKEIYDIVDKYPQFLNNDLNMNDYLSKYSKKEREMIRNILLLIPLILDKQGEILPDISHYNTITALSDSKGGIAQMYYILYEKDYQDSK